MVIHTFIHNSPLPFNITPLPSAKQYCANGPWRANAVQKSRIFEQKTKEPVKLFTGPKFSSIFLYITCTFSSVVERPVHIGKAVGSIPTRCTTIKNPRYIKRRPLKERLFCLLDFNLSSRGFEFLFDRFRFVFLYAFLHILWRTFNQILSFL